MQIFDHQPLVKLSYRVNGLLSHEKNEIHALLQIQSPARSDDSDNRPPLHLAIALDRSGSMDGQPLDQAKRCAKYFISQMKADDRVAIIAYDNRAKTLLPCQPVGAGALAIDAISHIHAGGSTDLHQGWMTAVEALKLHSCPEAISRELLLSDGCANQGLADPDAIADACREVAGQSISTSTYGIGRHFNEDLMTLMARSGEGQAYYDESAEDLLEPFQQEFDLLSSIYARKIRLAIECEEGITVKVMNTYMGSTDTALPDLAHGAEVWAFIRFHVPESCAHYGGGESVRLGEFRISGIDLEGNPLQIGTVECSLPVMNEMEYSRLSENELVARRLGEVMAAKLQDQAHKAAQFGHWDEVMRLLARARQLADKNPWIEAIISNLEHLAHDMDQHRFSKEARYSSLYLSTRYTDSNEGVDDQRPDAGSSSFTRRKRTQGKGSGSTDF